MKNTIEYFNNLQIKDINNLKEFICKMKANNYSNAEIMNKTGLSKRKIVSMIDLNIVNNYILELSIELTEQLKFGKSCDDINMEYKLSKHKIIQFIKDYIGEDEFNNIYKKNKNKKIKESLKKFNSLKEKKLYTLTCNFCKKEFIHTNKRKKCCSQKCANKASARARGLASAKSQAEIKRSKNEILFCELYENYFKNVDHNKPIFNGWDADIIIHDIKYAIMWNGRWHYEQCNAKHSVKQVQNRDKIKIKEIINFGYTPYIIKDMGKYNPEFVMFEFEKFKMSI